MRTQNREKTPPLNIRIKPEQRNIIERAATATGKSVSDFVRDAATREAQDALLDCTTISLSKDEWNRFIAALDAPQKVNQRLNDLMSRKLVWEK